MYFLAQFLFIYSSNQYEKHFFVEQVLQKVPCEPLGKQCFFNEFVNLQNSLENICYSLLVLNEPLVPHFEISLNEKISF